LVRRERPDIVHTHSWGTICEGMVAARLARVPHVVHGEHGTMELRPRNVRMQRWLWSRVSRVLSVSSRLADRMAGEIGHPRDRIAVIRNGVDLARFANRDRGAARAALGLPPAAFVVGTVGRLVAVKAHSVLLDAVARLVAEGTDCVALIAGDGPLRGALASQAEALGIAGRVRFLGHRPDVEHVLGALDVFVLSSDSEGLSNTIIEAMSVGLPVVATNVGGADELVREGTTGYLVPASDGDALAARIGVLARDAALRQRLGSEGRRVVNAEFSIARMVGNYQEMYTQVAAGGSGSRRHAPATCAEEPV
jgi:glycosyltransferase involved in cell wall biosynthesis